MTYGHPNEFDGPPNPNIPELEPAKPCSRGAAGWTQPAIIWWNDVDQRLPDSDLIVMIHCPISDHPVWLGYHDGEHWRAIDGELIEDDLVDNWAMMPDPPKIPFHASSNSGMKVLQRSREKVLKMP